MSRLICYALSNKSTLVIALMALTVCQMLTMVSSFTAMSSRWLLGCRNTDQYPLMVVCLAIAWSSSTRVFSYSAWAAIYRRRTSCE